jgi:hypothetical protein
MQESGVRAFQSASPKVKLCLTAHSHIAGRYGLSTETALHVT